MLELSEIENILNTFVTIESDNNVNSVLIDHHKLVKIKQDCHIYSTHCENVDRQIYIDSIRHEFINHTKHYSILRMPITSESKIELFDELEEYIKTNIYLDGKKHCWCIEALNVSPDTLTELNKNIFFCNHHDAVFAHELCYEFQQIYHYYILLKYIPDMVIILHYRTGLTDYLLKILNINNVIFMKNNEKFINHGTTYFSGHWKSNVSDNIIYNFFYNTIVMNTLKNCIGNETPTPKKIIFLRRPDNIVTGHIITNRNQVVELCNKYNYIEIDQTRLSIEDTIKLVHGATHIIQDSGSSIMHLLWSSLNVKSIIIDYSHIYFNTCAYNCSNSDAFTKNISNNCFCDITRSRKSKFIYNDKQFVDNMYVTDASTLDNVIKIDVLMELEKAIIDFE